MQIFAADRLPRLAAYLRREDPRRLILAGAMLVLMGGIFPAYLGVELTRGPRGADSGMGPSAASVWHLQEALNRPDLGTGSVPRHFAARLPADWTELSDTDARKDVFIGIMLPLALRANEIVLNQRSRLLGILDRLEAGKRLSSKDRAWAQALAASHGLDMPKVELKRLKTLVRRIDAVPPSLTIAQAAIESGWGSSRFAAEGNALFGQWAEEGDGAIVPANRDEGRTYAIKTFETLQDSVLAYMRNLNSHRAYRKFRAARAAMRRDGKPISGPALAEYLSAYSQKGERYVRNLRAIMEHNNLALLDAAALQSPNEAKRTD
jgi:Bax protein